MDQCQEHEIEVLSEWLKSLRITKETASEEITEYTDNMLIALVNTQNDQAGLPKRIVLDLE